MRSLHNSSELHSFVSCPTLARIPSGMHSEGAIMLTAYILNEISSPGEEPTPVKIGSTKKLCAPCLLSERSVVPQLVVEGPTHGMLHFFPESGDRERSRVALEGGRAVAPDGGLFGVKHKEWAIALNTAQLICMEATRQADQEYQKARDAQAQESLRLNLSALQRVIQLQQQAYEVAQQEGGVKTREAGERAEKIGKQITATEQLIQQAQKTFGEEARTLPAQEDLFLKLRTQVSEHLVPAVQTAIHEKSQVEVRGYARGAHISEEDHDVLVCMSVEERPRYLEMVKQGFALARTERPLLREEAVECVLVASHLGLDRTASPLAAATMERRGSQPAPDTPVDGALPQPKAAVTAQPAADSPHQPAPVQPQPKPAAPQLATEGFGGKCFFGGGGGRVGQPVAQPAAAQVGARGQQGGRVGSQRQIGRGRT